LIIEKGVFMKNEVKEYSFLIDNEWKESDNLKDIISPFNNEIVGKVYISSKEDVRKAIDSSSKSFEIYKTQPTYKRVELLKKIARLIESRKEELANIITLESGKPITFSRAEIDRTVFTFDTGASEAERIGGELLQLDLAAHSEGRFGIVKRFPVGPILAIVPFNFPMNLAAHKIAPAIAAGNTVIFKPSSSCLMTGIALASIIKEAGAEPGVVNTVTCPGSMINDFVSDEKIKFVSFTGSPAVGWALKSAVKKQKITLELGGNAGVIIDSDEKLDYAVKRIASGAFGNAGQSCISVQRAYVQKNIFDDFVRKFIDETSNIIVGDPFDAKTVVGSMITLDESNRAFDWIKEAKNSGAKILFGGEKNGAVLQPTVLTGTTPEMKVNCKEIFAPVITIEKYDEFEDAVKAVNNSDYGLQAGIFTNDMNKILYAYNKIDVGGLIINDFPTFRIDHMPYGGVKNSGFGREGIKYAIEEMTEPKLLVLQDFKI
jgi:acyl-CoA reductase-like NAD-dependent aldehyde dehydrogenase